MKNECDLMLFPFILAMIVSVTVGKQQCGQEEMTDFQNPPDGVCRSMHIRRNISQFRKLENCTIIEGYLRISLIEKPANPEEYDKWSFPELREITDYLALYRVYGLRSMRNLFPNLAVIGGHQLFNNYALISFELSELEELGLVNLRTIRRGGVRIFKSPKLCYLDTVDWEHLGVDPGAQDFKENKEESQCANYCPDECLTTKVGNVESKRCWTSQHCQQGLNCQCKMNQTCMENGTCCHENCLGGCSGTGPDDCFSCKEVIYLGRCLEECPPETYKYADRRCLTAKECFSMVNNTEDPTKNTKIVRSETSEWGICDTQCPQHYTVQEEGEFKNLECIKCKGFCPKVCNGSEVNSIEDAQKLSGCNKITGSLFIQIMGGSNVAYEMEKNLGSIKEVTGSIIVRRSYALLTLYFLRSLEIIGGENLYNDKSSFTVMDNSNLQDLFPEEQMKKIKIKNGTVSFHSNRKLCEHKIRRFVGYLNMTESDQDIGGTNGNLIPCIERELSLNVTHIFHNAAVLKWEKDSADGRHVLAYIINYKEIKSKNDEINIYEGRDACSADVWMTNEVLHINESAPCESFVLNDLKAYTDYAVYVQAYTLSTATYSAMTTIKTFKTNPYYPSEPLDLEVNSDDPHELYVKWKPPKYPNGIVTHYKVLYQKQELDIKSFEQRDYCHEPISTPSETTKTKEEEAEKELNTTSGCCACPKSKEEKDAEARKREIEIYFENYLHDQVYCQRFDTLPADININDIPEFSEIVSLDRSFISKNITSTRNMTSSRNITRNRNIINSTTDNLLVPFTTNATASVENATDGGPMRSNNLTVLIQEVVVNDTDIYLPNLEHFQEYNIEVQACHETSPDIKTKLCSNRALTAGRTKASWIMDKINESTINVHIIRNITVDAVITWDPPPKPNGLILTYKIFFKRVHQENLVPQKVCVNIREFQKYSGYRLTNLDPGNWTFQINAISLAGNGSFTSEKYFIVPHPQDVEEKNEAVIAIAVVAAFILIISVIGVWMLAKYKFRTDEMTVISPNANYIPSEPIYTMDGWEVDRDKIKLIKELGQGSFGMVYEGIAKGIGDDPDEEIRVAVKTVNDRASFNDKREFLKEATTMKAFDCYHVVKLLGVVSTGQPALVIMELMALGDLKNYLREHRPDEQERPGVSPPKLPDILQMAGEIADGMAYLADKKFVHRDLAARNCMVAEDKTVKIGDFGMTRDIYETDYYRKGGKGMLPVRWMAPESLRDGVFTSMSDVWSYGVVMWEMVTLAAQPYQGLSNEEVVKFISEDNTMDIPDRCPQDMAHLMQLCWKKKPKYRPSFKDIIEYLLPHLNLRFEKVSYYFNAGGGPRGMDASEAEEPYQEEESNDSGSFNSLSYEARAAPQLSRSSNSGNQQYHSSPHPSGGSLSFYDDGINPEVYGNDHEGASSFFNQRRGSHLDDSFEDFGDSSIHNDFGVDMDDSSQSFMPDVFQAIPLVKTWHSPLLSHDQGGNESTQHNSGLVELQPLINKDYGPSASSSRLTSVQPPSPYSSGYIGHQTSPVTTCELRTPGGSQTLQQHHKSVTPAAAAADPLASGSPSGSSHLGQSNRVSSGKQASSLDSRPTLRLPVLNKPPSGGFNRVSSHKQEDKDSNSGRHSQGNNQPSSSGWEHHQPSPAAADASVVSKDETSPTSSSQHNFPPGAITSSSDDSKESSKSSGSYSHMNGVKNGHIPMLRHRTAPC